MRRLAGVLLWLILLLAAGLPLGWLAAMLVANPAALGSAWGGGYALEVLLRTSLLASGAATLAMLLAVPAARCLARGRVLAGLLWVIMPAVLVVPGVAWAYGWAEFLRYASYTPRPQSWGDLARVAVTSTSAVWPIPAAAIGLAWRRLPAGLLDAAALDGATGRITARLLLGPALAGWAGAFLLAGQNMAAPDLTGVVTVSVVVRDTYNSVAGTQADRIAGAISAGLPASLVAAAVALIGWIIFRRSVDWSETGDRFSRPASLEPEVPHEDTKRAKNTKESHFFLFRVLRHLRAFVWHLRPRKRSLFTIFLLTLLALPPFLALLRTAGGFHPIRAFDIFGPELLRGLAIASLAAAVCLGLSLLQTLSRVRGPLVLSLAAFLLGGQFLALGMIHAYTQAKLPGSLLYGVYDTLPYHAAADVALFAWLALAAGRATWGGGWRDLRQLAAVEGANALQTAAYVVWPLAWPGLLAAAVAVLALSLTETNAAVLLFPGTLINDTMTNLHTLAYQPVAEAALLLALTCAAIAVLPVLLVTNARRRRNPLWIWLCLLPSAFCLSSCGPSDAPEAVWADSGRGQGQLIYPRAITYSPADDSFWVIDRTARVQHYDAAGNFLNGWAMPAEAYGKPTGVSVDAEGNVWVPDTHYWRVIVYKPDGTELFRFGEQGSGPGQFAWPTDVLVLPDGRVLVSEYGSADTEVGSQDRIQIFERNESGEMVAVGQIGEFGAGPGQFRRPQSMALVGETLWVADSTNHRLSAFTLDGEYLRSLGGEPGSGPGQFRFPYGLDVDEEGNLLVAEFGNNRIQRIDPETGQSLAVWGEIGSRPGGLKYPWALAYDARRNRTVVVDSGNDRLQVVDF